MPTRCWLMKCEPTAYTIDDLARDTRTGWEGVRNVKEDTGLEEMIVIKKGSRLSVQPVTRAEVAIVTRLGKRASA